MKSASTRVRTAGRGRGQSTGDRAWQRLAPTNAFQAQIPLDALGANGVDVTNVAKLYIGAGDREHPTAGGAGQFYLDDIRVGLAMPEE